MDNSIAKMKSYLVSEWSARNMPLTPEDVSYGSKKQYWWKGSCGHEWQTSPKSRSAGENCPICSGARVLEGINDLKSLCRSWQRNGRLKTKLSQLLFQSAHIKKSFGTGNADMNGRQLLRTEQTVQDAHTVRTICFFPGLMTLLPVFPSLRRNGRNAIIR